MVRIFLTAAVFALCSCSPGIYETLHRTTEDPKVVPPLAESYAESNTVFLSWDYDEGADEYILERAEDHPYAPQFTVAYRGGALSYADRNLEEGVRYVYRLSKTRGSRVFGPSAEVLGVSSVETRDSRGNNDMKTALRLYSMDYISSIYYNRSYGGLEITEEDWFYVDIPPLRKAWIMINDFQAGAANTATYFEYYVFERESGPVIHLNDFAILNNELETARYYLKIYPAKKRFVENGASPGGGLVHYKISLHKIEPITSGG